MTEKRVAASTKAAAAKTAQKVKATKPAKATKAASAKTAAKSTKLVAKPAGSAAKPRKAAEPGTKPAKPAKQAKPVKPAKPTAQPAAQSSKSTKPAGQSATQKSATQKSTAPKPAAPKSAPAKPTAPKLAATKPAAAKPAAPKPVTKKPVTKKKPLDKETARQILFETSEDRSAIASQALADPVILATLVENLSGAGRRIRQFSAATINEIALRQPEVLVPYTDDIADALHRPEAQTRWECLEALSNLVEHDPPACEQALHGAEISLYDDGSGMARLAALRFFCAYGALDARRAQKVWPLIEEAIQCYHGDPEFQDMLISVAQFAEGKIGKTIKQALAARMDFDAKNSKGSIGRRAREIVELCK